MRIIIGDYYEANIQVRPEDDKVLDYILKQADKDGKVKVVKIVKIKKGSGVDIYLSSWRFAIAVSRKLKKVFGGSVKITRKIYGMDRQTTKSTYRVTVLFRLPPEEDKNL